AHTDGTVRPVRVYSLDLEWDTLHAFDVYTESEPGFSTTFSIPVAVPADIAAEWVVTRDYAKARREFRVQGVDFTERSLIEEMGTLQRDLSLNLRIADRLNNTTGLRMVETLNRAFNDARRLVFGGSVSIRTVRITVVFSDGSRSYDISWGLDETFTAVVIEVKPVPETARDLDGNIVPDSRESFEQLLDAGGFRIIGSLEDVEQLVRRFSGSGGGGGVSVRVVSGTVSIGVIEVVGEEDAPPSSDE
ncbi:MAG: hypothetical protein CVV17_11390, partial [Gammaproteobacteria bacterium HGW-Gammaproteobacteria-7]